MVKIDPLVIATLQQSNYRRFTKCHNRSSGCLSSPLSCRYFAISFGNTLLNSMISRVLNFYNKAQARKQTIVSAHLRE